MGTIVKSYSPAMTNADERLFSPSNSPPSLNWFPSLRSTHERERFNEDSVYSPLLLNLRYFARWCQDSLSDDICGVEIYIPVESRWALSRNRIALQWPMPTMRRESPSNWNLEYSSRAVSSSSSDRHSFGSLNLSSPTVKLATLYPTNPDTFMPHSNRRLVQCMLSVRVLQLPSLLKW